MITVTDTTPPGGWRYTQPETGYEMQAMVLPALRAQVQMHRKSNREMKLDLDEGWWERVQAEMCLDNPGWITSYCDPNAGPQLPSRGPVGIYDLLTFFRAMRKWVFDHGFSRVSKEEQDRRRAICKACPHNIDVKGCTGCQGVVRWLGEFMDREEVEAEDPDLKNCGVCGCVLKLKTILPAEVIRETTNPRDTYPDHCWVPRA